MSKSKKIWLLLAALSLSLILVACGSSDVNTGADGNSTEKKDSEEKKEIQKEDNTKKFDASDQTKDVLGMKVGLGEIQIAEDKISVGMNIENTTDKPLSFYPDQGQSVVGDMQLDANLFMTTGSIGGDVQGGVKQDGVIEFLPPEGKKIDVEAIDSIKLIFGDVTTDDFMKSEPVNFEITVK